MFWHYVCVGVGGGYMNNVQYISSLLTFITGLKATLILDVCVIEAPDVSVSMIANVYASKFYTILDMSAT